VFTHVSLYRLRKVIDRQQTIDLLANLAGRVPSLRSVEVGTDRSGTPNSFDVALILRFDDYAGYSEFVTHTAWKRVSEHIAFVADSMVSCDFKPEESGGGLWRNR
jgi:hypothetical protein